MIRPRINQNRPKKNTDDHAVKIGLGADVTNPATVFSLVSDAMNSPATTIPVIEQQTLDYAGPINDKDAVAAFPTEWKFFNHESNPGVDNVQTTFQHPGILQSAIIVKGVGFHVFAEPICFTSPMNLWTGTNGAPDVAMLAPISPDVFSPGMLGTPTGLAALGLATGFGLQPGTFSWGWKQQLAAWHLIEAYTFQWTVRQRYDLLKESARYVAHFGSFSDKVGAGTSQVAVMPFFAAANRRLRDLGAPNGVALPITHKRQGVWATGGEPAQTDTFIPSRAYMTADVTYGGLALQETYRNQPIHMLPVPYCIKSNSPLGLNLVATDEVHLAELIRLMSVGNQQGAGFPATQYPDAMVAPIGNPSTSGPEVDLNATPAVFNSPAFTGSADVSGGNLSIGMLVFGWEVTDDAMEQICSDPSLKAQLNNQFGILIAG
jgi:hypothetical protein